MHHLDRWCPATGRERDGSGTTYRYNPYSLLVLGGPEQSVDLVPFRVAGQFTRSGSRDKTESEAFAPAVVDHSIASP